MDHQQISRLEDLLSRHDQVDHDPTLGNFYLGWGVFILLGMALFLTILQFEEFWVYWTIFGILIQTFITRMLKSGARNQSWRMALVSVTWICSIMVIPLFTYVFPYLLKLYHPSLTFIMVALWLSLASYAAGLAARKRSLQLGSISYVLSTPFFWFFPASSVLIFSLMILGALVIPGIVSRYES